MSQFYFSMGLAILGSTTYHIFQKSIPHMIHPSIVLMVTYTMAFLGGLVFFFIYPVEGGFSYQIRHFNVAMFLPGICIIGIEAGFLLAYRAGWNINLAPLIVNLISAIALIPIGWLLFDEELSMLKSVGIGVCLIGLVLINWE
jgi:drug/metabolite transporter (DMT)-like permease